MILDVTFIERECSLDVKFTESKSAFDVTFGELYEVAKPVIPSDYGKITYNQDKTIIVS